MISYRLSFCVLSQFDCSILLSVSPSDCTSIFHHSLSPFDCISIVSPFVCCLSLIVVSFCLYFHLIVPVPTSFLLYGSALCSHRQLHCISITLHWSSILAGSMYCKSMATRVAQFEVLSSFRRWWLVPVHVVRQVGYFHRALDESSVGMLLWP